MLRPPISNTFNYCSADEGDSDRRMSWASGSALLKTVHPQREFHRSFLRNDLAVGITTVRALEGRTKWWLDGHLVLDKKGSATAAPHDLIIVPPGCEFQGVGFGNTQGLWLFIEPLSVCDDEQAGCLIERAMTDSAWSKDLLTRTIISELRKELLEGNPRGQMFLEESVMLLTGQLAHILVYAQKRASPIRALHGHNLQMIIDYLESNLHRNITLSEMSTLVGITPKYFCEAFKQATGISPHQFQIRRRIDRAKALLRNPASSLSDVALAVGFRNQHHLNDHFQRIAGIPAVRYRAEVLTGSVLKPPTAALPD